MGWSLGFDSKWNRFIGYGVPAYCDHPDCSKEIDRGLAFICGGEPYGGDSGCGLYFCYEYLYMKVGEFNAEKDRYEIECGQLCERCFDGETHFKPKSEHLDWIKHILTDESWAEWREDNPEEVIRYNN